MVMRLRRTSMIASANATEKIQKFLSSDCDAIILDLEDGVPYADKPLARENVIKMFREFDFRNKERIIRVNTIGSDEYLKDMSEVVAGVLPDSIRVPKCETREDVLLVDQALREIEQKAGCQQNTIEIVALIESPLGVRNAYEIASSCTRVAALALGMEDLTRTMGVKRRYLDDELDLIYARQKVVLDAKSAHVQALDSVLLILGDYEAAIRHARASKQDGFSGRTVGDIRQVAEINRIYSHSPQEVLFAQKMKKAYEKQTTEGKAEAFLDNQLVCCAAYEGAIEILEEDKSRHQHATRLGLQY
jgi:citrate lyase subunit beta/citryl-CoA lyase